VAKALIHRRARETVHMYGLVNQAIEDMALRRGGQELWAAIVARYGAELPVFVAMETYDDAVTYRLVAAASDATGMTQDEVLEAFGEHWILYTAEQGYGPMLGALGATLPQFLSNLDAMHSRIALTMPALRPPSFACSEVDETTLRVQYWSERSGLSPMVVGLLKGLGARFELDVTVAVTDPRPAGVDYDTFLVTYEPAGAAGLTPAASVAAES
jgi:hypothetical protein